MEVSSEIFERRSPQMSHRALLMAVVLLTATIAAHAQVTVSAEAFNNATVQPARPRTGSGGKNFRYFACSVDADADASAAILSNVFVGATPNAAKYICTPLFAINEPASVITTSKLSFFSTSMPICPSFGRDFSAEGRGAVNI
jgi:hypothetical protein